MVSERDRETVTEMGTEREKERGREIEVRQ